MRLKKRQRSKIQGGRQGSKKWNLIIYQGPAQKLEPALGINVFNVINVINVEECDDGD